MNKSQQILKTLEAISNDSLPKSPNTPIKSDMATSQDQSKKFSWQKSDITPVANAQPNTVSDMQERLPNNLERSLTHETVSRPLEDYHKSTLHDYTGINHTNINGIMRGKPSTNPFEDHKLDISDLKEVTNNSTGHSFHAYRAINHLKPDSFKEGDTFKDHAFTSTTLDKNKTEVYRSKSGTNFRINVHAGSKGAYIAPHSKYPEEKEYLIHSGTTFRVGKHETDEHGNPFVNLHIHSQED